AGEGGEDFEAGNTLLHGFANLPQGGWGDAAGQDVMESEIRIRMATKDVAPTFNLFWDGLLGGYLARLWIEITGEVDDGRHPTKSRRPAGRFRGLGHDFRTTSPVLGHWDGDMGMRLDPARQYNVALGLDDPGRLRGQATRRGDADDLALLHSYIALSHVFWG